jgi:hypothetical protein
MSLNVQQQSVNSLKLIFRDCLSLHVAIDYFFVKSRCESAEFDSPCRSNFFNELCREVMVGYEAAERGELIGSEVVFGNLREKLAQRRGVTRVNQSTSLA